MSSRLVRLYIISAIAALATPARAEDDVAPVRVEIKTLSNVFHDYGPAPAFDGYLTINLASARIMAAVAPREWVAFDAHGVVEVASMNIDSPLLSTLGADAVIVTAPQALPLQASHYDQEARFHARARFDRLNARFSAGPVAVIVGRQPISVGVSSLFPLLDRITPVPVTAIEHEYVPGIDAAQVEAKRGSTTVRALYAFGGDWETDHRGAFATRKARIAAIVESELLGGHVVALAALLREMPLGGVGYRYKLDSVELTAEVAGVRETSPVTDRGGFLMATGGVAFELPSRTSVLLETSYLGFAATHPRDYPMLLADERLLSGDLPLFFNRHQAGLRAVQPITDSLSASMMVLAAADGSGVGVAGVTIARDDDLAAKLEVWIPFGPRPEAALVPNSEYALVTRSATLELRRTF